MTTPTPQAPAREAVEQIQKALAKLPADADSPWMNLDKMPYIHKTDDPKASPWNCAVVGRFDYLQTMDYMLACQPSNIRAVLALLAAKQEEAERLMGDLRASEENQLELQKANLLLAEEVDKMREALEEIALAGMSPSPEMSENGVEAWHARQAWRFIGIAARAISPARAALSPTQGEAG